MVLKKENGKTKIKIIKKTINRKSIKPKKTGLKYSKTFLKPEYREATMRLVPS
jgi:hypothetical protein